eukprot:TRINITY_DN10011_c0_g1_i1.p2 TRINITY_DN10011_c0_g1~~TRINITY_DN10011_c0_g1_i1.p2  ORF type:complete len:173 (+),score=21.43 TRINITY_DN10011_c0_g1_i1:956-1474(+)
MVSGRIDFDDVPGAAFVWSGSQGSSNGREVSAAVLGDYRVRRQVAGVGLQETSVTRGHPLGESITYIPEGFKKASLMAGLCVGRSKAIRDLVGGVFDHGKRVTDKVSDVVNAAQDTMTDGAIGVREAIDTCVLIGDGTTEKDAEIGSVVRQLQERGILEVRHGVMDLIDGVA